MSEYIEYEAVGDEENEPENSGSNFPIVIFGLIFILILLCAYLGLSLGVG